MPTTKITAKLHEALVAGEIIQSDNRTSILRVVQGRFEMTSDCGKIHTLDIASTDAARLNAHWQGFAA